MGELVFLGEIGVERTLAPAQFLHHRGQAVIGLRPHDQIDHRLAPDDLFALGLGHTARHADLQVGLGRAQRLQPPKLGIDLLGGLFPDMAGVQQDHVRLGHIARFLIALGAQGLGHALAVIDIHLTAIGFHKELLWRGHGGPFGRNGTGAR